MSEPRDYLDGLKAADYYGRNPLDPAAYLGRHAEPMTATYTDRQPGDDPEPGERFDHARKHKAVGRLRDQRPRALRGALESARDRPLADRAAPPHPRLAGALMTRADLVRAMSDHLGNELSRAKWREDWEAERVCDELLAMVELAQPLDPPPNEWPHKRRPL